MPATAVAKSKDFMEWYNATANSVEPLASLRLAGGGRCPPPLSPRAGAFRPRDPLTARASRSHGEGC